jgi:hypothetical protein
MLSLAFSKKSLEVQRKVVCEEFKEHYINKPYGDAWHKMRSLAYTQHPYRWMTIGASLAHVEDATMEDVKDFFFQSASSLCMDKLIILFCLTLLQQGHQSRVCAISNLLRLLFKFLLAFLIESMQNERRLL